MLLNLFKKKKENEGTIETHLITVKRKYKKAIHVGQIISIELDPEADDEKYYILSSEGQISSTITPEQLGTYKKYRYGLIKSFDEQNINILIICCDGYLQRLKIKLNDNFEDGSAFIIKNNELYNDEKIVGKIIDYKYESNMNVVFNELDNNKLVVFIRK